MRCAITIKRYKHGGAGRELPTESKGKGRRRLPLLLWMAKGIQGISIAKAANHCKNASLIVG
jgi:hypothetical protein